MQRFFVWYIMAMALVTQLWAEPTELQAVRLRIQNAANNQQAFDEAFKTFQELQISSHPERWDFHALMTSATAEQENFEEVQRLLTERPLEPELSIFARYYYLIAQARMNQFQGDLASARKRFEEAYGLAQELKDPAIMVTPLIALAFLNSQEGNTQLVLEYLQKMLALEPEATPPTLAVIYAESAGLYYDTGDYQRAVEYGNKAVLLAEKVGNKADLSAIHSNLGLFHAAAGDPSAALRHRLRALELTPQEAGPSVRARRRLNVGVSLHSLKRHAEAYEVLKDLPAVFDQAAIPRFQVESRRELASVLKDLGRIDDALHLYEEARTLLEKNDKNLRNDSVRLEILDAERLILAEGRRWADAYKKAEEAIELREAIAQNERDKGITEFRIKYDTAVKEKEKQQLESEAQLANFALERERESNRFYRTLILTLATFILILSILVFYIVRILRQLQAAKALTESQAQEIETILATIDQSIFTLRDDQLRINQHMSRFARDHFQVQPGTLFPVFLAQHFDLPKDELRMITSILSNSIDMLDLGFMTDCDKLPKELTRSGPQGVFTYEVDWVPILRSSDKRINQFLICIRNVTEFRKLKNEFTVNQDRLYFLGRMAECGRNAFLDFHKTWHRMSRDMEERLHQIGPSPIMPVFQRHVHTLKGMARTLSFSDLSNLCHTVEEALTNANPDSEHEIIRQQLAILSAGIGRYHEAARDKLGWDLDAELLHIERKALEGITRRLIAHDRRFWREAQNELMKLSFPSLKNLLEQSIAGLPELARSLQKPTPEVHVKGEDIFLDTTRARMMSAVLPHLLRNACDHGIETEEKRRAAGKEATGNIYITLIQDTTGAAVEIWDDGQGLNLSKVSEIARRKGLIRDEEKRTAAGWAELIFHPGFSTAQSVSDISGRGIGMDAVRELLKEAGGTIELLLENPGTESLESQALVFKLTFPILALALSEAS